MSESDPRFAMFDLAARPHFDDTAAVTAFIETEPRPSPSGRPWVVLNMIASLDGAMSIDGLSGGLGGPADKVVFRALRGLADVILVGAGTARAESYGPPVVDPPTRERRLARGQAPAPTLALVTRSASLDASAPMFAEATQRPLVYVSAGADPGQIAGLHPVADVVETSNATADGVDIERVLADLGRRGHRVVLAEGGPSLNGNLVESGVIDELCLSISPTLVGGDAGRIVRSESPVPSHMELSRVFAADDLLFLRYTRAAPPSD